MGVAVISSTSHAAPFAIRASRWSTPKRCSSSIITSPQLWHSTSPTSSACVPKHTEIEPEAKPSRIASRSEAGVEPVSFDHVTPDSSRSGPNPCAYWSTSTSVGPIMRACSPESAAITSAYAATMVLPVPTSPRSIWRMRSGAAMRCEMSATARCWSPVKEKGMCSSNALRAGPSTTCVRGEASPSSACACCIKCISSASTSSYTKRRRAWACSAISTGK